MAHSFWTFQFSIWTALSAAVIFTSGVALSLWNMRRDQGGHAYRALEALRWLVLILLLFTLFRPEYVRRIRRSDKPRVVVLCDASESMETLDVRVDRQKAITRSEWLDKQKHDRVWSPLENRYQVTVEDIAAPPKDAPDPGTDLDASLKAVRSNYSDLQAILLLSDGDWTEGRAPVSAASELRRAGIPVFSACVGSDSFLPDLDLKSVSVPAYALLDEHLAIPFTIRSRLPHEVKTTVSLIGPNGEVAAKDVRIPSMSTLQDSLLLVPRATGNFELTVRVPVQDDEVFKDNNEKSFSMSFRREILKVLLVDTLPRWEYRYMRNAMVRDPGVDVDCLLLRPKLGPGVGAHYIQEFPSGRDELSKYDVVFLGDVGIGPGELTREQTELLRGLVEKQGSGLVFMPGSRGREISLLGSPLEDLMPVILDRVHPEGEGALATSKLILSSRGRDHLLTMLANTPAANQAVWKSLPGYNWHAPVVRARPGADVLAVDSSEQNINGRLPLLVTQPAGSGKTLFMGTDSAWRWRRGVEDVYHYRFWGQVVRWMAHQRHMAHQEGLRFFYNPEAPRRGDRVLLHATAFNAQGLPLKRGRVTASITSLENGKEVRLDLAPEEGGWGVYTGSFVPEEGGAYRIRVRCEETKKEVTADISVSSPRREAVGRPARADVLREISHLSGGKMAEDGKLSELINSIQLLPEARPQEERLRLWSHPLWATLIIALLAIYWSGRKLIGKI